MTVKIDSEERNFWREKSKTVMNPLNGPLLRSMHVAKQYKDNQDKITNIHFSNDGMNMISSSADDQIIVYDCEKGTKVLPLNSKKYGVDLIHFAQNKNHAVHASTKENDIIRWVPQISWDTDSLSKTFEFQVHVSKRK